VEILGNKPKGGSKTDPRACKSETGTVAQRRYTDPALTPRFADD
jgi:hypothetical protein